MTDEKPKADRAASQPRPVQSSPDTTPEEKRYPREELLENARTLLHASPHAVAGALSTEKKETFTLEEAVGHVKDFLGRKIDEPEGES
jgi:hypothetical protein